MNTWILEARQRQIAEVAEALGMDVRRNRMSPCPACRNDREKGLRRGPVGLFHNGWICNICKVRGDGLDLVAWKLFDKPTRELDAAGWRAVRDWFGAGPSMPLARPRAAQEAAAPDYPPIEKIGALWGSLMPLSGPPTEVRVAITRWLQERGLSPDHVASLDVVRCGPAAHPPKPADERAIRCPGWPWCAVLPLVDATGLTRSLVFRAVEQPQVGPKSYALAGYERRGLVLADPMGRALLSQTGPSAPTVVDIDGGPSVTWDGVVRLVEGEPDFLTWAADPERIQKDDELCTSAILGWLGSAGLPMEIAQRIPTEARVVIYPHQDANGAGERAAKLTRERLKHVRDVRKGKV